METPVTAGVAATQYDTSGFNYSFTSNLNLGKKGAISLSLSLSLSLLSLCVCGCGREGTLTKIFLALYLSYSVTILKRQ